MITHLAGVCQHIRGLDAVLEVGGVGLLVTCTPSALAQLREGESARLATAMVIREDGWTLFGFADDNERDLFALLQTVTGVGPKMAAGAVGALGVQPLCTAVMQSDARTLVKIPGVGKKLADRIILELRDKALPLGVDSEHATFSSDADDEPAWRDSVVGGLESLGWQRRDAETAADLVASAVNEGEADPANIPGLLKLALASLDRA
jgi:holliday junction DNA helicase RuvA